MRAVAVDIGVTGVDFCMFMFSPGGFFFMFILFGINYRSNHGRLVCGYFHLQRLICNVSSAQRLICTRDIHLYLVGHIGAILISEHLEPMEQVTTVFKWRGTCDLPAIHMRIPGTRQSTWYAHDYGRPIACFAHRVKLWSFSTCYDELTMSEGWGKGQYILSLDRL